MRAATGGEGLNITLDAGDSLSTDTYFGSFYLSHWQALTDIDHLAVVVGFAGHGKVRVLEVGPSGTELLCEYKLRSAGVQRHLIAFRRGGLDAILADGQTAGRLYVEVVAITACQVQSIDFVTETAPRQDVRLSIGMSTFNDTASQIGTVLPEVMMVAAQSEAIRAVYLVNHGAELSRVGATLQQAKLHHLAPAAEDAPGGLAQTIAAARAAGDGGTHHLVLADDQLVDARLILRAVEFLRHAKGPLILGAPALDARRPTALLAAAVVVGEAGQFRYAGQGKDLIGRPANTARRIDPLAPFAKVAQTDYCPWWFCVLPLDTATALPQRGYARGDDFAYEQEEHSRGVQSLTLPGMGVWRMPSLTVPDSNDLTNRYLPLRRLPAEDEATPPRQLHLLQGTMFPADDLPEIMYLRVTPERRRGGLVPRQGQSGRPVICLDATSFLSTDTFFGSFYRAYWHEYTKVRDLSLVVELS
ncbi:MAG: hypothetical protein H7245_17840, partial [Candidatus Saccharibacteria bacterium]|nr:hypothetical protein [Pseudorhodobacter sp.]